MFGKIFSKRQSKKDAKPNNRKNDQGKKVEVKPLVPTKMGHREMAELMMKKMPVPDDLTKMLNEIVYVKAFSEVNKDILRLIRRVSIVVRKPAGEPEQRIVPHEEELPAEVKGSDKEGVYLVMLMMNTLLQYFESDEEAKSLQAKMISLYEAWVAKKEAIVDEDDDPFVVLKLIEAIGGDQTKTALAVRCIHQSVAICGHTHIKSKVCPLMTKDIRGNTGWQVQMTLAEYVQVRHSRRECSIEPSKDSRNHWELEFAVHLTFDKNMKEITASKLSITDLQLSESMEDDLAEYLNEKFNKGSLVVC